MTTEKNLIIAIKGFISIFIMYLRSNTMTPIAALADSIGYILQLIAELEDISPDEIYAKLPEWQIEDTIVKIQYLVEHQQGNYLELLEALDEMETKLSSIPSEAKYPYLDGINKMRHLLNNSENIDTSAFDDYIEGLDI